MRMDVSIYVSVVWAHVICYIVRRGKISRYRISWMVDIVDGDEGRKGTKRRVAVQCIFTRFS